MDERTKVDCVANARALAPVIAAAVPRIEAERQLPADLVDALHEARMFRMLVPRSLGGEELSPIDYVQAVEELAKADAATAWCIAQTSVCSTISKCLNPDVAAEIFKNNPRGVLAWGPSPNGRAVAEKGGFRVSGVWPFASGSRHATWLAAHCRVYEPDGQPRHDADGNTVDKTFVVPREQASISDVWHVMGLKGTGSDTYTFTDVFVPQERGIGYHALDPAERRERGPLYAFTIYQLFGSSFPAVALGIARASLDAFCALAQKKTPMGQAVAVARQRRGAIAGRCRSVAARRRTGVFSRCLAGDLAGGASRPDIARPAGAAAHGLHPRQPAGPAGRRDRLPGGRCDGDFRKQSVRAPVPRHARRVAAGAVAFRRLRGGRPAFSRPAAELAADLMRHGGC